MDFRISANTNHLASPKIQLPTHFILTLPIPINFVNPKIMFLPIIIIMLINLSFDFRIVSQ